MNVKVRWVAKPKEMGEFAEKDGFLRKMSG
jgi:hypothetical protein